MNKIKISNCSKAIDKKDIDNLELKYGFSFPEEPCFRKTKK